LEIRLKVRAWTLARGIKRLVLSAVTIKWLCRDGRRSMVRVIGLTKRFAASTKLRHSHMLMLKGSRESLIITQKVTDDGSKVQG
jgi:hypothetical protein